MGKLWTFDQKFLEIYGFYNIDDVRENFYNESKFLDMELESTLL